MFAGGPNSRGSMLRRRLISALVRTCPCCGGPVGHPRARRRSSVTRAQRDRHDVLPQQQQLSLDASGNASENRLTYQDPNVSSTISMQRIGKGGTRPAIHAITGQPIRGSSSDAVLTAPSPSNTNALDTDSVPLNNKSPSAVEQGPEIESQCMALAELVAAGVVLAAALVHLLPDASEAASALVRPTNMPANDEDGDGGDLFPVGHAIAGAAFVFVAGVDAAAHEAAHASQGTRDDPGNNGGAREHTTTYGSGRDGDESRDDEKPSKRSNRNKVPVPRSHSSHSAGGSRSQLLTLVRSPSQTFRRNLGATESAGLLSSRSPKSPALREQRETGQAASVPGAGAVAVAVAGAGKG